MSKPALTFDALRPEYYGLFSGCAPAVNHLGVANAKRLAEIDAIIEAIFEPEARARYEAVANKLVAVPWYFIGCLHNMECSLSFGQHLHNGDPLKARTVNVPAGRPLRWTSAGTWEESAWDACEMKGMRTWKDWDIAGLLFQAERFNGWGYRLYHPATLSPYLWGGSNRYVSGKYVADGKWSDGAVSAQIGIATLIRRMVNTHQLALRGQQIFPV